MIGPLYNHLRLSPHCGICADTIARHERIVAVYGDNESGSFRGLTEPFLFPQVADSVTEVDGFSLCHSPGCKSCVVSPEFVPLHWDCFEVYRDQCSIELADALPQLWLSAAHPSPKPCSRQSIPRSNATPKYYNSTRYHPSPIISYGWRH